MELSRHKANRNLNRNHKHKSISPVRTNVSTGNAPHKIHAPASKDGAVQPAKNLNAPNHATMATVLVLIPVNATQATKENYAKIHLAKNSARTVVNAQHPTHAAALLVTTEPLVNQLFAKKDAPTAELAFHQTYAFVSSDSKEHSVKSQFRSSANFRSNTTGRSTQPAPQSIQKMAQLGVHLPQCTKETESLVTSQNSATTPVNTWRLLAIATITTNAKATESKRNLAKKEKFST